MAKEANKKKKGFISRLMEALDKKMEKKAKKTSCCCNNKKEKGRSCC